MTYDFSVLRQIRKRRKLTIDKLSQMAGVSYVAISKLERSEGNPGLRTLDRICRALKMPTHNLLALAERKHPAPVTEKTFKTLGGKAKCRLVELDGMHIFHITAQKGARGAAAKFTEDDYERCFVLEGRIRITIHGSPYTLKAGDGLCWDCFYEHEYEVLEESTFITILTPKQP